MKDGRTFVETLELSGLTRHQDLVEPGMTKAVYSGDLESPWLAKEFAVPPGPSRPDPAPAKSREKPILVDPVEDEPQDKGAKSLYRPGQSAKRVVPTLRKRTLKVSGRVPRILPVKLTAEPRKEEPELIQVEVVAAPHPLPIPEAVIELSPMALAPIEPESIDPPPMEPPRMELPSVEIPPHVQVQFIPTPKKRGPRSLSLAEEPNVPPVTKPLKIIRKRKEEAPKVFETEPKPVPQAMLEGIKTSQENGDQID
jgi:hypothetical protein